MSTNGASALKRSPSPLSAPEEAQGRQRSRAACAPCRQRKRKCDGKHPCGTCLRYEYQCEYTASKRPSYGVGDTPQEPPAPAPLGHTKPSIIQLQAHPLTAPGARFHHRGILDPTKTRFVRANSAIAFPRILGMDLESDTIPRLHSFAWHTGRRAEPNETLADITNLLAWPDMQRLSKAYFRYVKPEIGLLDEPDFLEQAAVRFAAPQGYNDFDAVALGVAALGSFFSPNPHPKEESFILTSLNVLTHKSMSQSPTVSNVAGWILRTVYLRLTARPHASWISSSITMHQVEASGLHKELQTIAVVYPAAPTGDHKAAKIRRRLFWIARALNIILSFEYGRSRVNFEIVTTKKFAAESGGYAHQFVELANILPNDIVDPEREPDPPAGLSAALTKIEELQSDSSFITLLKADCAFAIYRRLWLMSLTDAKDRAETVMALGKAAMTAVDTLLHSRTPWWNIVVCPFQFVCVSLAVGTPRSLASVPEIIHLLHRVAQTYDTHMVREAYNQAVALVGMACKRKRKELDVLSAISDVQPFEDAPTSSSTGNGGMMDVPNLDWTVDMPFEWDVFLNPDLVMSSQQTPAGTSAGAGVDGARMGGQMGF